jgi:hypothetical protein
MHLNPQNRYAQNRYQQIEKLFGVLFCVDHQESALQVLPLKTKHKISGRSTGIEQFIKASIFIRHPPMVWPGLQVNRCGGQ